MQTGPRLTDTLSNFSHPVSIDSSWLMSANKFESSCDWSISDRANQATFVVELVSVAVYVESVRENEKRGFWTSDVNDVFPIAFGISVTEGSVTAAAANGYFLFHLVTLKETLVV